MGFDSDCLHMFLETKCPICNGELSALRTANAALKAEVVEARGEVKRVEQENKSLRKYAPMVLEDLAKQQSDITRLTAAEKSLEADVEHLWKSRKSEMAERDEELERLKKESESAWDKFDAVTTELVSRALFYRDRARAWKRCAKRWQDDYYCAQNYASNYLAAHRFEFEGEIGNRRVIDWATTTITKAPPDWHKWPVWADEETK